MSLLDLQGMEDEMQTSYPAGHSSGSGHSCGGGSGLSVAACGGKGSTLSVALC